MGEIKQELLEKIKEVKKALKDQTEAETRTAWEQCKKYLEKDGWTWETYSEKSSRYFELVRKYFADE